MNDLIFEKAAPAEFSEIKNFYWSLIDEMSDRVHQFGWIKGVYPSDDYIKGCLEAGEFYVLRHAGDLCGCVILNSSFNEGYAGTVWSVPCDPSEALVPHALAISPAYQGAGLAKKLLDIITDLAKKSGKKAVRLDIVSSNTPAERLYTGYGFKFIQEKVMFYEDTGWTDYKLYELDLRSLNFT